LAGSFLKTENEDAKRPSLTYSATEEDWREEDQNTLKYGQEGLLNQ
jgi:hypothetical protein